MNSSNVMGQEFQYALTDASGAVVWTGTNVVAVTMKVTNANTTTAIELQEAVLFDSGSSLGRADLPATSDPVMQAVLKVKRISALADVGFIGFSLDKIAASGKGQVAGTGSIGWVRCTSGAIAAGSLIRGSATAGLLSATAAIDASNPVYGTVFGVALAAAAQQGATGSYMVLALVAQS